MEFLSSSSNEAKMLISYEQLWSLMMQYVTYLNFHNQTSDPKSLIESARRSEKGYNRLLYAMLHQMSKHGMPGIKLNTSIFRRMIQKAGMFYTNPISILVSKMI